MKRLWCWERLRAGGEGDDRGWDGWMASPTQWTWVWVDSRSWWWTGRPGVLRFIVSQRVRHDWLNWTEDEISVHRQGNINGQNNVLYFWSSLVSSLPWASEFLSLLLPLPCPNIYNQFLLCLTITSKFFLPHPRGCGILVLWPGIEPTPPAMEDQSLNHWTSREAQCFAITFLIISGTAS